MALEPTNHDAMPVASTESETETSPPQPLSTEQFEHDDPRALYARMRPDQRTAIGEEFARGFRLSSDANAQQRYGAEIKGMLEPERVAEMHGYARTHHPEIFAEVMRHPVTRASLEAPGMQAEAVTADEEQTVGSNVVGSLDRPGRIEPGMMP
jgi:glycine/D-amino acid oxidase-like deaminating enzyme